MQILMLLLFTLQIWFLTSNQKNVSSCDQDIIEIDKELKLFVFYFSHWLAWEF